MIEARAIIENIDETRKMLESLGAVLDGEYSFKDVIFVPREGNYDLNKDFLRARVYIKNNWYTKKVVLVRKQAEFKDVGKTGKVILKEEFDSEKEANGFVEAEFGQEFKRGFEYERVGWQYNLESSRIFVEDIKGYKSSIEIEADTQDQIKYLFQKIGIVKELKDSLPEIMRKTYGTRN